MKSSLTKNIGLKIVSLFAAFFLWLIVVNVDDPIISRTYTGISVEVLNADIIEDEGKCYEILDNSNVINVVVTAKRSVVDQMSRDYIKATADFASMTFLDKVPIEVRSTRYSDQIESVTTRADYLKINLEDIVEKSVPVRANVSGEVALGYTLAEMNIETSMVLVKGPQSVIETIEYVSADIDITGIEKDTSILAIVNPYNKNNNEIIDQRVEMDLHSVEIQFLVDGIKEIPISCGYSGNPVGGYVVSGSVMTTPSSVRITGRGENYDDMDVIYISPDAVSIEGAMASVEETIDISDYLPTGVRFADVDFVPEVRVDIPVDPTEHKVISVPLSNITISNLPENYIASIVDIGGTVDVEIQGLGDTFDRYSGELAIGTIDATNLIPRNLIPEQAGALLQTGENDGIVMFDMPIGISVVSPVNLMVIVDYIGDAPIENGQIVTTSDGAIISVESTITDGNGSDKSIEHNNEAEDNGEANSE